jgi:solute carrier family 44 protein 1 (choline transporter-like protein)
LATADYESRNTVALVAPGSETEAEAAAAHISLDDSGHDYDVHLNESIQMSGISKNRTISAGDISVTSIDYSEEVWVKYMWWIYLIGLIWCSEFILSCQQMVIASAVSSWYFSRDRTKLKWVITRSVRRLVKYHLGSMALGSLVITVVKVPRLIFSFLQRVLRKWEDRTCIKWVSKGCTLCLSCFESWLKYVHHNAYTVIAIQCINFCPAGRLAFSALLGNALQISVVNSIGDFVLFLAKCSTAALTGVIAIIVFRNHENVYFYAIPVILTVLFAYFVAHSVISVFEMAVDTLFLCFCEDHNMNAETQNFYAPSSLLQYMRVDAPHVLAMRYDCDAGPIPVKQSFEESATAEERYPMNVIHRT